ncbi:MAG TPA: ABC transporter ATP-binding protein [Candidatus Dormibacteraeota bacterium]
MTLEAAVRLRQGDLELDVKLEIKPGEVVALLGPNGAGKTTLLRALAGLVPIDSGYVRLDGLTLEDTSTRTYVPTEKRPIGFVFQDYLLFPHMSVLDNVAFGLRGADAKSHAASWLERVGLRDFTASRPQQLSGGQRQRAALARALGPDPRLLLLDEPMAALDASARAEVRRDLKRHLSTFEGIRLLVTHDPLEAVALADRLLVIEKGRLVQEGTPAEVAARPRSAYVADLVGMNLLRGAADHGSVRTDGGVSVAAAGAHEGEVFVVIHPRAVALHAQRPEGSPRNVWRGRTEAIEVTGERARVRVTGPVPLVAEVTPASLAELHLAEGSDVWISFKATDVSVYPA